MNPLTLLRIDDQGADVALLQQQLMQLGFNPGEIDGDFGTATEQAVMAFQLSRGLLPDGIAGPRTLKALGLVADSSLPDATDAMTVQIASRMCPGALLSNIKANLPVLLQSLRDHGLHDRTMVLMAVASIRAETSGFVPISEGRSKFNSSPSGHPFDLYDHRGDLGNQGPPDGERYCGRGFIQLTGRHNYRRYGPLLQPAIDLETHPELANAADVAADLLCLFLGDRELLIKDALMAGNFQAARRLVNGGKHGLAEFTRAFQTGDALMP
ncbi:peptidoglycan-binding protein [Aquabacterium sp.]|uniref:peptidoglycan-binding protein n=1 Tax=Aquabacterium sp. TaxID=1872578 RepID=UPI002B94EFF7|nr:peptidoglycan-binding protein [Aquabacterium sp.]HSW08567.1 peptidoglycan-binding protein [Aquabacterium sp.]